LESENNGDVEEKKMEQEITKITPLAYRLRDSAEVLQKNGHPILSLHFPLKYMVLHPHWAPVFESLIRKNFVAFQDILSLVKHADPVKAEIFLNDLVRKGFLEQQGLPILPNYPYVSIIVPVRNRPQEITACLLSLSRLDYPAEKMEVIVVDDASEDKTPNVVSQFPVHLITLEVQKQASYCRNLAAHRAKGDILAFLDSDCVAGSLWLKELVPAFNDPSTGAVGGLVDSYFNEKGLDRYEQVKSSLNMGSWPKSSREDNHFFYLPTCNLLVRNGPFFEVGGFRDDMVVGEDVDFCWRLQDQGHHVEYRPVGRIFHKHRNKLRQFCTRRFDYGTSEPLLQRSHPRRIKQFVISPVAFIFWALVLLSIASGWMPLFGLCGAILLTESLMKYIKINRKSLPIAFPRFLLASFREYFSLLYHCCAFVSRYYLFWAFLIFLWAPRLSGMILLMHVLAGIVEYTIKKPHLNIPQFLFYFTLDQISYQLGVWWGCFKKFFFKPINPQIVRRP
jgi:mycofactocin system glycosyltransferase